MDFLIQRYKYSVSGAGEIFEGVLQIARGEYEENKLPYLAYLYVSIAFTDSVSRGEANRLICQLESLTYRKICILTAISQKSDIDLAWRPNCFNLKPGSDELAGLMQDCFELETQGLVQENCDQSPSNGMHSWAFVVPAHLDLTLHGKKLIDLAQLAKLPEKDTSKIHEHMHMLTSIPYVAARVGASLLLFQAYLCGINRKFARFRFLTHPPMAIHRPGASRILQQGAVPVVSHTSTTE